MHLLIGCLFIVINIFYARAQNVSLRLLEAVKIFEADPLLKHASISLFVVDSKTGKTVFEKNPQTGLAPASCQKIITSVAAFELLGKDYRYKTELGFLGKIEAGVLNGHLIIAGSGDPTLGSWRWQSTKEEQVLNEWINAIRKAGITAINGTTILDSKNWSTETVPDGWIWQDIGNYYGAGASSFNWRENQYELILKSGKKPGDACEVVRTDPKLYKASLTCEVITAAEGSGDNAFIYLPPYAEHGFVRGTIPAGEEAFSISGSLPNSGAQLRFALEEGLQRSQINMPEFKEWSSYPPHPNTNSLHTHFSPSLDSINYWFLKKSVNLYGEAILKTIGHQEKGVGSTAKGLETVKHFWSRRGIERAAINIHDGSGLSPQNRVTTNALVKIMQYARARPWFHSFYSSLPEINGIKMKSGSIGGVKSYTGYIQSKDGNEYTFSFIVNNYDGSANDMVRKMWKVLDGAKGGGQREVGSSK